jgi:hypothetical protein
MAGRRAFGIAGAVAICLCAVQEGRAAGLLTDRLSSRGLKAWKAIEQVVSARDRAGRPLHPTLQGLWLEAEASRDTIYIEMPKPTSVSPHTAGNFCLEPFEPGKGTRSGVIRLYLDVIDCAGDSELGRRANGFLPFEGLPEKRLRYAEVLGHELVHALLTLNDPGHAALSGVLDRATMELAAYRQNRNGRPLDPGMLERLARIRSMSEEIERRAEAVEIEIWRELRTSAR